MSESGYIVALDQGTTGTTGMLIDGTGAPLWTVSREIRQMYPRPGWVEHDPVELFESCLEVIEELLEAFEAHPRSIVGIGIANQRETLVMWDRRTGEPVSNAIVWQCRRTAELCDELKARGYEAAVRQKTGLPIDAYFTGTKIRWLLDEVPDGQRRAERGELACGTVDSWLIWNFTNKLVHATDVTNASRTMLFNIDSLDWDDELLAMLNVPRAILPDVRSSSEVFGHLAGDLSAGQPVPIAGVAGDQHASLFGQCCFEPGSAKNTYGTGCFALVNTGRDRVDSSSGLITTVGWADWRRGRLCAGGERLLGGRYGPVAARRAGDHRDLGRVGAPGVGGCGQRRRVPGARVLRAGGSLLGHVRTRRHRRPDARVDGVARSEGGAGIDRLPDPRHTGRDEPGHRRAALLASRGRRGYR